MQSNYISKIISMEKQDISPAVHSLLQNSQPTTASTVGEEQKLYKGIQVGTIFALFSPKKI